MSIIKSKQAGNFTVLSNDIFKSGLSIEAIGLLAYFLSLPHDWVIYKTKLHTQLNIGREKLDRVFKELQDSGYILSVKRQQESGRFEHEHIVYDKPYNGEPASGEPDTALPPLANQPLLKKEDTKEKIQKNRFIPPTLIDVVTYFMENGYSQQLGTKAFNYYNSAGWKDSNGNQVRNWKQKMQGVWFKEENKVNVKDWNKIKEAIDKTVWSVGMQIPAEKERLTAKYNLTVQEFDSLYAS